MINDEMIIVDIAVPALPGSMAKEQLKYITVSLNTYAG